MIEYLNEFRLVAHERKLDDSTAGEWLQDGMNPELQNACRASSDNTPMLRPLPIGQLKKKQSWLQYDISKNIRQP